jgi:hypothetical protein
MSALCVVVVNLEISRVHLYCGPGNLHDEIIPRQAERVNKHARGHLRESMSIEYEAVLESACSLTGSHFVSITLGTRLARRTTQYQIVQNAKSTYVRVRVRLAQHLSTQTTLCKDIPAPVVADRVLRKRLAEMQFRYHTCILLCFPNDLLGVSCPL